MRSITSSPQKHLRWRLWGLVGVMLLTFVGQLGLQGLAHVGESPRATLYRLTSIDIAPHSSPTDDTSCGIEHHHHPLSHHHHDGDCPLCPLLGHILFTLVTASFFLGAFSIVRLHWVCTPPSHAPPHTRRDRPPSRAPPFHPEIILHTPFRLI